MTAIIIIALVVLLLPWNSSTPKKKAMEATINDDRRTMANYQNRRKGWLLQTVIATAIFMFIILILYIVALQK